MSRKNRSPEGKARRAKICELLQMANSSYHTLIAEPQQNRFPYWVQQENLFYSLRQKMYFKILEAQIMVCAG